jgi:endonuclease/exonuclease/phosphatase family metal-dependent hydrolase
MKILTLNTWQKSGPWRERWNTIIDALASYKPDVVAFQELFDADWRDYVAERAGFPYRAEPDPVDSGLVVLSRRPVTASELHRLSPQSPFEQYFRYLLRVEIAAARGTLHVFNTHLSWQAPDQATRMAQIKEIHGHLEQRSGGYKLLMGDMNAPPHDAEIKWLLDHSGLVDSFSKLHSDEAGFTWNRRNPFTCEQKPPLPDRRIDYIFAGKDLIDHLSSCRVVCSEPGSNGILASDHFGLLADFGGNI